MWFIKTVFGCLFTHLIILRINCCHDVCSTIFVFDTLTSHTHHPPHFPFPHPSGFEICIQFLLIFFRHDLTIDVWLKALFRPQCACFQVLVIFMKLLYAIIFN